MEDMGILKLLKNDNDVEALGDNAKLSIVTLVHKGPLLLLVTDQRGTPSTPIYHEFELNRLTLEVRFFVPLQRIAHRCQALRNAMARVLEELASEQPLEVCVRDNNFEGVTALHAAAAMNHASVVEMLLATSGIETDAVRPDGVSSLLIACRNGHTGIADFLLRAGADVKSAGIA